MGGIIGLWLIFFVLVVAPVVALELYVLVWMCGPAIRRASRRVAEGWYEVVDRRALIEDAISYRVPANSKPPVATGHATAAPAPTAEKKSDQTRDAGHRWLGGGR